MRLTIIGKIINQLRAEQELSLEQLSERSGIPVEKLSSIEQGQSTPSIGAMMKISRALGSRLGTLLDAQESSGAVVCRAKMSNDQPESEESRLDFYSLAQGKKDRMMEPVIVEIQAGQANAELLSEHQGEELIYVLEGSIEIHYGQQTHLLCKGDSIYYDSHVPHWIVGASAEGARILAVIYTPY